MNVFLKTTHLSLIIEESKKSPVIIFKYSNECLSSNRVSLDLEKHILEKKINIPVYRLTVQTEPTLSKNIAEYFDIKHETPQILIINKTKVIYTAHHNAIKIADFILE